MRNKIITHITSLAILGVLLTPVAAFAGSLATPTVPVPGDEITGSGLENIINDVVSILLSVSVVIGVGAFVYGAIQYFALNKEKEGKATMMRAVIGVGLILAIGLILNTIAGLINRGLNVG